jgi:hypothetical protein
MRLSDNRLIQRLMENVHPADTCGTKSRGITAKERYLREAYIEVRRSDEG